MLQDLTIYPTETGSAASDRNGCAQGDFIGLNTHYSSCILRSVRRLFLPGPSLVLLSCFLRPFKGKQRRSLTQCNSRALRENCGPSPLLTAAMGSRKRARPAAGEASPLSLPALKQTHIHDLPDDCLMHVFAFLDPCLRTCDDFDGVPPALELPPRSPVASTSAASPSRANGARAGRGQNSGGRRNSRRNSASVGSTAQEGPQASAGEAQAEAGPGLGAREADGEGGDGVHGREGRRVTRQSAARSSSDVTSVEAARGPRRVARLRGSQQDPGGGEGHTHRARSRSLGSSAGGDASGAAGEAGDGAGGQGPSTSQRVSSSRAAGSTPPRAARPTLHGSATLAAARPIGQAQGQASRGASMAGPPASSPGAQAGRLRGPPATSARELRPQGGLSAGPPGALSLTPGAVHRQRPPGGCVQCGALRQRAAEDAGPYDSGQQFVHALVCRRWLRVARQTVSRVALKKLREVPALRLASELGRLPGLSHLSVPFSRSLPALTLRFWSALPASLRNLRVLHLGSPGGPGERVQTQALHLIFSSCPLLEDLGVRNMDFVRAIPESLGCATRLVRLSLRKRPSLGSFIIASLPDSVRHLLRLEVLDMRGCVLLGLPPALATLPALRVLRVQVEPVRNPQPARLQPCLDVLRRLQDSRTLQALQISSFIARDLPESLFRMPSLVSLSVHCCPQLTALPLTPPALLNLRHLRLINCEALVTLPDSLGALPSLLSLDVAFCSRLRALPESLGSLLHLRAITLVQCPRLGALPDTLGGLHSLEELLMFECGGLTELPPALCSLPALRRLFMYKCGLTRLPRALVQLIRRGTTVYLVGRGAKALLASFRHCNFRFTLDGTFAVCNVAEPAEEGRWLSSYFTSLEQYL